MLFDFGRLLPKGPPECFFEATLGALELPRYAAMPREFGLNDETSSTDDLAAPAGPPDELRPLRSGVPWLRLSLNGSFCCKRSLAALFLCCEELFSILDEVFCLKVCP